MNNLSEIVDKAKKLLSNKEENKITLESIFSKVEEIAKKLNNIETLSKQNWKRVEDMNNKLLSEINKTRLELNAIKNEIDDIKVKLNYIIDLLKIEK